MRRVFRWSAVAVLVLLLVLVAAVLWIANTTAFPRWALEQAASATGGALQAGGIEGTLADGLRLERLEWRDGETGVELSQLSIDWQPARLLSGEFRLRELQAARVEVFLAGGGGPGEPARLPDRIGLPLELHLDRVAVGELLIDGLGLEVPTIRNIEAGLHYQDDAWQLEGASARAEGWGAVTAQATVGAQPPFALDAQARAVPALPELPGLPPLLVNAAGELAAIGLQLRMLPPPGQASVGEPGTETAWVLAETNVRPFEPLQVNELSLKLAGFEPQALGLPGPQAQLSGEVVAQASTATAWQGRLALRNAMPGPLDAERLPVTSVETRFEWFDGRLTLDALDIDEGTLAGRVAVDTGATRELLGQTLPAIEAQLALRGLDLRSWLDASESTAIGGTLALAGEKLEFDLSDAKLGDLSLAGVAALVGELLELESLRLHTPGGSLEASGSLAWQAPQRVDLAGRFDRLNPARLAAIAGIELPARLAGLRGLSGDWSAKGLVAPELALDSKLRLQQGQFDGEPLRIDWQGRVSPTRLSGIELKATLGKLSARLAGAAGSAGDKLAVEVRAPSLALLDPALSGSLRADGELALAGLDAAAVKGGGVSLRVQAQGLGYRPAEGEALRIEGARVSLDGTLGKHRLEASVEGGPASGSLAAQGALTLAEEGRAPSWRWQGTLDSLALRAPLPVRLAAPVALSADPSGASAGAFSISAEGGGRVALERLSFRDGRFDLAGQAEALPLTRWAERFGVLPKGAPPVAEIGLDADWDLAGSSIDDLDGRLAVELLTAKAVNGDGRAELRFEEGRLAGRVDMRLPSLAFANPAIGPEWVVDGRLQVAGEASGTLREPRFTGTLDGRELTMLQREFGWRLDSGVLDARFDGERLLVERLQLSSDGGTLRLDGQVRLEDRVGGFDLVAERLAVPIGPGQRVVISANSRIESSANALLWSGKVRVDEGLIELRGGSAPTLPGDVVVIGAEGSGITARRTAKPEEPDARAAAGKGKEAGRGREAGPEEGFRLGGDLAVDLGEQLRVRGSGIDARLAGDLTLQVTLPGEPRATGTVRVRDGSFSAYGQRLEITRGRVVFNGAIDNPALDIVAMRRGPAVEAGVAVTGTVLSPRIQLVSEPDVPDAQKLSWLVLGVGLDDARTGGQMAALQAAASTLLGGEGTGGLAQSLGLDTLTIRNASSAGFDTNFGATFPGQTAQGAAGTPATQDVVAIGKRLGSRVSVSYEQGLRGVWSLLRLQYDIGRRLSVRAQTGTDTAVDLLYGFAFD